MAKMIQVRNVPSRFHRELVRRARLKSLTLTDYMAFSWKKQIGLNCV